MTHPFLQGLRAPLHISHRGGAGLQPENTLRAFEAAVRQWRTDVLELDVHATKDGEIVVAHDSTVERCTEAEGAIAELTFCELSKLDAAFRFKPSSGFPLRGFGVRIPRFVEVLRAFPGVRLNVELKDEAALPGFVALVKEEKAMNRICGGSEFDAVAISLAEAMPELCLFYPADALASFILPVLADEPPTDDERFTVLDMPLIWQGLKLFEPRIRDAAAARGKWINVWTVDDPRLMREAIADGVGGIMTDRPDLLRDVLG